MVQVQWRDLVAQEITAPVLLWFLVERLEVMVLQEQQLLQQEWGQILNWVDVAPR